MDCITHACGPQDKKFCSKKNIKINFIIRELRWSVAYIIFAHLTSAIILWDYGPRRSGYIDGKNKTNKKKSVLFENIPKHQKYIWEEHGGD